MRETRRIKGLKTVTENDALSGNIPDDTIALSGYKIDVHSGKDTGLLFKDIQDPFGISYGCLIPQSVDNLMVAGRCISADAVALGSLRIIPTCMALGQAAGVGASLAVKNNVSPKNVDVIQVRTQLLKDNAILEVK